MKTRTHFIVMAFVAIAALLFANCQKQANEAEAAAAVEETVEVPADAKKKYVVIREAGKSVLHEYKDWGGSGAIDRITTVCCDTVIVIHEANRSLYENKKTGSKLPPKYAYDRTCPMMGK